MAQSAPSCKQSDYEVFGRDLTIERRLEMLGVKFRYRQNIDLEDLAIRESLDSNARFKTIDDDHCSQMAVSMSDGELFPAIVIDPSGRIWAGNNRVRAAELAGVEQVDAYEILNGTEDQYEHFIREDNLGHGLGYSEEEKIQHCIWLNRRDPKNNTMKDLSRKWMGSQGHDSAYNRLVTADQADKVEQQLFKMKIIGADDLPRVILQAMHVWCPGNRSGSPNVKVLRRVARTIINSKMNGTDAVNLIKMVKEKETEKDKLAAVSEFEEGLKLAPDKHKRELQNSTKLVRQLKSLLKFLEEGGNNGRALDSFRKLGIKSEDDKKKVKIMISDVSRAINKIKGSK